MSDGGVEVDTSSVRQKWTALVEGGLLAGTWYEARVRYCKVVRYLMGLDRRLSIVDVGCGTGGCLSVLERLGFVKLFGVEITGAHVKKARERCPTAFYVIAEGERLPFRERSFDCAISVGAIEHYIDSERGMAELCRIVRGMLVVTSDCYAWRVMQLLGLYRSFMPVDRALWPLRFFGLLRSGGMEVVHYDGWGITHYRRGCQKLVQRLGLIRRKARTSRAQELAAPELEEIDVRDRRRSIRRWLRLFVLDENVFCAMRTDMRR